MKQMNLFDYIEQPEPTPVPKTTLERLFGKICDPVTQCANCLCRRCANNAEGQIELGEVIEVCFNCDECRYYTGEYRHRGCDREDCEHFIISEHAVKRKRKRLRVIKQV